MDNFLDSVTRKGRKVKERLRGKKGKRGKTGANTVDESIGSPSSLLRPVPHIAVEGPDGGESRTSTDARQVHSRGRSHPEPVSVGGGRTTEGREADADEKEVSQDPSCLEPSDENAVGDGSGPTEAGPLSRSPSTPILLGGQSHSTGTVISSALSKCSSRQHRTLRRS